MLNVDPKSRWPKRKRGRSFRNMLRGNILDGFELPKESIED